MHTIPAGVTLARADTQAANEPRYLATCITNCSPVHAAITKNWKGVQCCHAMPSTINLPTEIHCVGQVAWLMAMYAS
jgi:hypothetical protein